jgi:actin-related protein 2
LSRTLQGGSFVGQQVLQHASQLDATWPIRNGMIYEWREMTAVWSHAFSQVLQVQPRDCRILLTEPLYGSATSRTAMLDVIFETFGFQAASIQIQPVLSLLAEGAAQLPGSYHWSPASTHAPYIGGSRV